MVSTLVVLFSLIVILGVYLATTSIYMVVADKMLLSLLFGTYRGVYVSGTYLTNTPPAIRGRDYLPGHVFDFVILLYPFWRPVFLPSTNVELRYRAGRIYTKDHIPVQLDATIIFQLDACLSNFVETFNVLGKGYDLAREESIHYVVHKNMETGEISTRSYQQSCLAQIILDDTTNLVHETLRRAAADMTWAELKHEIVGFEEEVMWFLASPESVFARAGMLRRIPGTAKGVETGESVRKNGFDIQFEDVLPMDAAFFESLSAPATGANRGLEEGNRIKAIQDATGLSSEEIIRNETLRAVDDLTVIGAGDQLTSMLGGLLQKGVPKSSRGKKPRNTP